MKHSSANVKLFSYFIILAIFGSLMLQIPWAYVSGDAVPYIDSLFTAVSALCVTGLSTVSMDVYTTFGLSIIMFLIEAGGLGVLTFISLILSLSSRKVSLVNRKLIKDYFIDDVDSSPRRILKSIIMYTIIIQTCGALLLMPFLKNIGEPLWIFYSFFFAVSAFCNAGFSPYSTSLLKFENNPYPLIIIMLLIVLGGLGFLVIKNILQIIRKKTDHLYLHSKIVIFMTSVLILSGAAVVFFTERNKALAGFPVWKQLTISFFQSITTRTAGFEVVPQAEFSAPVLLYNIILMFVGGSSGSIAGGVKTTTAFIAILYVLNGNEEKHIINIGNRQIDPSLVNKSISIISRSVLLLFISMLILSITESVAIADHSIWISDIMFEVVSAFGTVGLSQGITGILTTGGKIVIILTMFIGRTGIFAMTLHITNKNKNEFNIQYPTERILLG